MAKCAPLSYRLAELRRSSQRTHHIDDWNSMSLSQTFLAAKQKTRDKLSAPSHIMEPTLTSTQWLPFFKREWKTYKSRKTAKKINSTGEEKAGGFLHSFLIGTLIVLSVCSLISRQRVLKSGWMQYFKHASNGFPFPVCTHSSFRVLCAPRRWWQRWRWPSGPLPVYLNTRRGLRISQCESDAILKLLWRLYSQKSIFNLNYWGLLSFRTSWKELSEFPEDLQGISHQNVKFTL